MATIERKGTTNKKSIPLNLFHLRHWENSKIGGKTNKYKAAFLFFVSNKYSEQQHVGEKRSTRVEKNTS